MPIRWLRPVAASFAAALFAACWIPSSAAEPAPAPADLLTELKPPDGFVASVFAPPSLANYPVFVAATVDGTLFVSSDGNGSLGRDPHRGRVLRLRDTDDDGTADEVREFVKDLDSPRGLVWVDGRLVVLHPPHVTAFTDDDGDGVADDQAGRRLISGIAFDYSKRPADHTSNGLALGIDGWIYAAIGDFGFMEAVGVDGRKLQLRGGGIVRFRPDGTGLDLFARGTRNTLEAAVGPLLDMIARDNTNDGGGWNVRLHAFTGLEDHGYPRRYMHFADEIVAPLADYGGGSGTGGCWIDEPWMPEAWNDAAFTCDWGRGEVYRHAITARGAGYEAGQQSFLKIPRSTDLDADAKGNVYAASWRGGSFSWKGPEIGFIARLRPTGAAQGPVPDFKSATVDELVAILAGPSHRLRLESQRALLARSFDDAGAAVESLASSGSARLSSRVAAAFTLALGRRADAVPCLLRLAGDPSVAAWAVRALGDLAAEGVAIPRGPVVAMLRSDDPRTRKEAVVAIARMADASMIRTVLPHAADADPIVSHTAFEAAVRMSRHDEAAAIDACCERLDATDTSPAVHRAAARVLGEIHSDAVAEAVIARLAASSEPSRRADLAWAASRLWRREAIWKGDSWGTRPDTRGPYYAVEEWSASPRLVDAVVAIIRTSPPADLPDIARGAGLHRLPTAAIVPALTSRKEADASLAAFLDLSGDVPAIDVLDRLASVATAAATPDADRLAALRVLARSPDGRSIPFLVEAVLAVERRADSKTAAAAREVARSTAAASLDIRPLLQTAARGAAHQAIVDEMLMTVAGSSVAKSAARGEAAARLADAWRSATDRRAELVAASVRTGSRVLAHELVSASEGPPGDSLATAAKQAVRSLGIDPNAIRAVAADTGPKVGERTTDELLKLVDERRGDRAVGAELFVSRKCIACHAAGVDSAGLGPSLANAAGIYNRKQLAESVLLPNKSIAQGFATTAVVLDDGRPLVGFVTAEADDSLTIRDAQGLPHVVDKRSIEDRRKLATSVMPEGLVADLTVAQFASLLDYVESFGTVKPQDP